MADIFVNEKAQEIYPHGHYYDVDLCWIVNQLKRLIADAKNYDDRWDTQEETNNTFSKALDTLQERVTELETMIAEGTWPNDALLEWANNNMPELVSKIVKYVFFGLSRDGHFVAYIPQSWNFIKFNTILDHNSPMWGHLILRW